MSYISFTTIMASEAIHISLNGNSEEDFEASIAGALKGMDLTGNSYKPITVKRDFITRFEPSEMNVDEWTDVYTEDGELTVAAMPYTSFCKLMEINPKQITKKDIRASWNQK